MSIAFNTYTGVKVAGGWKFVVGVHPPPLAAKVKRDVGDLAACGEVITYREESGGEEGPARGGQTLPGGTAPSMIDYGLVLHGRIGRGGRACQGGGKPFQGGLLLQ